jgi:hypothetical protein
MSGMVMILGNAVAGLCGGLEWEASCGRAVTGATGDLCRALLAQLAHHAHHASFLSWFFSVPGTILPSDLKQLFLPTSHDHVPGRVEEDVAARLWVIWLCWPQTIGVQEVQRLLMLGQLQAKQEQVGDGGQAAASALIQLATGAPEAAAASSPLLRRLVPEGQRGPLRCSTRSQRPAAPLRPQVTLHIMKLQAVAWLLASEELRRQHCNGGIKADTAEAVLRPLRSTIKAGCTAPCTAPCEGAHAVPAFAQGVCPPLRQRPAVARQRRRHCGCTGAALSEGCCVARLQWANIHLASSYQQRPGEWRTSLLRLVLVVAVCATKVLLGPSSSAVDWELLQGLATLFGAVAGERSSPQPWPWLVLPDSGCCSCLGQQARGAQAGRSLRCRA